MYLGLRLRAYSRGFAILYTACCRLGHRRPSGFATAARVASSLVMWSAEFIRSGFRPGSRASSR